MVFAFGFTGLNLFELGKSGFDCWAGAVAAGGAAAAVAGGLAFPLDGLAWIALELDPYEGDDEAAWFRLSCFLLSLSKAFCRFL